MPDLFPAAVLIPLNSGLHLIGSSNTPSHRAKVLIPLNSGLHLDLISMVATYWFYRLNPFEFRASFGPVANIGVFGAMGTS